MKCFIVLATLLAVIYAQTESELAKLPAPQQTLIAPAILLPEASISLSQEQNKELTETQIRNKRAPILVKALLGKTAILGAGALGAGALGAGALGAGAVGAGLLGAGVLGAGLYAKSGGYANKYGYANAYNPGYHYHNHYHSYPQYNPQYYPHSHHYEPAYDWY